jgi:hypothetical protein
MYSFYMDIKKIFRYLMISLNWKRIGFGQVEPRLHPDLIRGPKGPLATFGRLATRSGAFYGNVITIYGA